MKVILNKDIVGVGKRGDVKEVKDGYFRNFLMPSKLAEIATTEKLKKITEEENLKLQTKKSSQEKSRKELDMLSEKIFPITKKVNEKGSLYKAITAKDIVLEIKKAGFGQIQADWINLDKPIKGTGKNDVEIKNPDGYSVRIFVEVTPEK